MKKCTRCGDVKPLEAFPADTKRPGGRRSDCKACHAARARAYRARNRERVRQIKRDWEDANRDKKRAYQATWRAKNVESERARNREFHAANPHVAWVSRYRTRARALGHPEVVEDFTRADVVARYGDACAHCGGPFEELDHYPQPVALGGPHVLANVRPSCVTCNRRGGGVRRAS